MTTATAEIGTHAREVSCASPRHIIGMAAVTNDGTVYRCEYSTFINISIWINILILNIDGTPYTHGTNEKCTEAKFITRHNDHSLKASPQLCQSGIVLFNGTWIT